MKVGSRYNTAEFGEIVILKIEDKTEIIYFRSEKKDKIGKLRAGDLIENHLANYSYDYIKSS